MGFQLFSFERSQKFLLFALDTLIFAFCILTVFYFRLFESPFVLFGTAGFWYFLFSWNFCLYVFAAYDLDRDIPFLTIFIRMLLAGLSVMVMIVAANYVGAKYRTGLFGRGVVVLSLIQAVLLGTIIRWYLYQFFQKLQTVSRWLFIIPKHQVDFLKQELNRNQFLGQVSFVESGEPDSSKLKDALFQNWTGIVVASNSADLNQDRQSLQFILDARFRGARIYDLVGFYEMNWRKVPIFSLEHYWFVSNGGFKLFQNPLALKLKRLMDLFLSVILLVATLPLLILAAILVKLESPGEFLFRQVRVGKNGQEFVLYKIRSMKNNAEADGAQWAQSSDSRVTRVGKWLRKTRIDELPQLFNVFIGEMSIIGPRPERPEFIGDLQRQIPFYQLRHMVQPGLTGWAQVLYPYGATLLDAVEKLQFELFYIKNRSVLMDLQILIKTIKVVLFGRGQ